MQRSRSCWGAGCDWSGFRRCQVLRGGGEAAEAAGTANPATRSTTRANSNQTRFMARPPLEGRTAKAPRTRRLSHFATIVASVECLAFGRRSRLDGTGASRAAGPCWVRTASGSGSPGRARAVTMGRKEPHRSPHPQRPGPPPLEHGRPGFEPLTPTAAVGLRPLPTRQVVIADGPHPPVELMTTAATLERGWSSPAVPSACPGATSGPHPTRQQRTTPGNGGHSTSQLDSPSRPASQVVRPPRFSLARRKSPGAGSALGPCRNGRAGHQRSPTVQSNRRSLAVQLTQPG
jgi:hypothetical protein